MNRFLFKILTKPFTLLGLFTKISITIDQYYEVIVHYSKGTSIFQHFPVKIVDLMINYHMKNSWFGQHLFYWAYVSLWLCSCQTETVDNDPSGSWRNMYRQCLPKRMVYFHWTDNYQRNCIWKVIRWLTGEIFRSVSWSEL